MKARLVLMAVFLLLLLSVILWAAAVDLGPFSTFYLRHFGLLFASTGLVLILLQFVFVSRIKFIEDGFGLDRMFWWHRLFGRVGLSLVAAHAAMIILYRLIEFGELFPDIYFWVGLTALVGFSVTAALAVYYKKIGLAYETWRNIHLFNYLLFPLVLIHVFYHALNPVSPLFYLWLALAAIFGAVVVYRLVRINAIRNNPYEVVEVKQEADDIWSLFFKGKKISFKPGQFMLIQLLRSGKRSSPHPFTISNSPTREHMSITPKELGDFTSTIKDTKVGDQAYIDAPYGVFSFLNYNPGEIVYLAGGIGITPFMSMIRYIHDHKLDLKVTLFWANRDESYLCFRNEIREIEEEMEGFKKFFVMSDQPDWPGEKGLINSGMIKDKLGALEGKDFFICGPPPMIKAVIADLKENRVPPDKIHTEIFEL